uniref:hypothetical protein n=1 Tax=Anaerobiospirillum succiniciproducens TaxID=13335 RepID=UPI0004828B68
MKQTNNAIKFLMAQYRAIFKNANIAMVAAIAAAALAAGQAQAAGPIEKFDNTALTADTTPEKAVVAGDGATDGQYKKLELTGGANRAESAKALEIKITAGDAHTIKGVAAGADATAQPAKPNVNLGNTALVIEASAAKLTVGEAGTAGSPTATPAAKTNVTLKNLTVTEGALDLVADAKNADLATTVTAANVTFGAGEAAKTSTINLAKHSSISATALTVKEGATVNVSGGAALTAGSITVESGSIALGTASNADDVSTLSSTGKLNIKGGTISVDNGSAAGITAASIDFAGELTNSGTLTMNGAVAAKDGSAVVNDGTITIADGFTAESGSTVTNNNDAAKVITFKGQTTFKAGSKITNSGAMVIAGTANFELDDKDLSNALEVGGDNAALKVVSGGTANMSAAVFKGFLAGKVQSKASTSGTIVIKAATDPINLQTDAGILTESGDMSAKLGGAGDLKVKTENAKFVAADAISGAAANAGVTLSFNKLDLGKNESGFTVKKVNLEIAEDITVKSNKGLTLQNDASLTLNGTGKALELESITLGEAASAGTLNVNKGNWGVKTLTVTSGTANVNNSGTTLTISTGLTTDSDGKLVISGGTVDAKGVTTLSLGANGASITNAGKLILSSDMVVKAADSTLITDKYDKNAVQGTTDAQISLLDKSGNAISMTLEKFKQFREDTGFKGLFDIKLSNTPETKPQMGLGGAGGVVAGVTNGYE